MIKFVRRFFWDSLLRLIPAALLFTWPAPLQAAGVAGISVLEPIDLAPGKDVYQPLGFAANHMTHRLYVFGGMATPDLAFNQSANPTYGIKVIETSTNTVVTGIDLGLYQFSTYVHPFEPRDIAIDESQTSGGNQVYVLGVGEYVCLRVIDGATNTNQTGQGTDIVLPSDGDQLIVNPNNHKIYVVSYDGTITVVDGPNRSVLKTLTPAIGLNTHTLILNPQANKVFVFGPQALAIINSDDDTYTIVNAAYFVKAGIFDPNTGHVLMAASEGTSAAALYALDGINGTQLQKETDIPENIQALAIDTADHRLYLGQPVDESAGTTGQIAIYDSDILGHVGESPFPPGAAKLIFDRVGFGASLYFLDYDFYFRKDVFEYKNMVGAVNPVNGVIRKITVGYDPGVIAVNPRTNQIYVADQKAPELTVIDGATRTVVDRIAVAPAGSEAFFGIFDPPPRRLAVSVANGVIYLSRSVTDPDTGVSTMYVDMYDGVSHLIINSLAMNVDANSANYPRIAIDDTRERLYLAGYSSLGNPSYFVNSYNVNSTYLATYPLSANGLELAANPITGLVYIAGSSLAALVLDPGDGGVTEVNTGAPGPIAINGETNRIFFARTGSDNSVSVIDGTTGQLETTIPNTNTNVGDAVTSVALDPVTNTLFVGDDSDGQESIGRITVFDGNNSYSYLGQIDVGRYPENIAFNTATRQLLVGNDQDGTLSVLQSSTPSPPDRLANISTRLGVEVADNVLIGGFIVTGPAGSTKQVLIRGIGPSLTGLGVSGALVDPVLELHSGATVLATNDNWKFDQNGKSQQAAIEATTIPPLNDLESAVLMNLTPGSYTAVLSGKNSGTGVGLVEVYDLTESATIKMVNISTRGRVDTGDDVMIGGVIVTGTNPSRVLLRAIGPSLAEAGVSEALQDPVLELHDGQGQLIRVNDDWQDDDFFNIAATGIPPTDNRESALLAILYPGNYTAVVKGKNDSVGVGLVEAYFLSSDN